MVMLFIVFLQKIIPDNSNTSVRSVPKIITMVHLSGPEIRGGTMGARKKEGATVPFEEWIRCCQIGRAKGAQNMQNPCQSRGQGQSNYTYLVLEFCNLMVLSIFIV